MINVEINKEKFKFTGNWSELTIEQAGSIYSKIVDKLPEKVKTHYNDLIENKDAELDLNQREELEFRLFKRDSLLLFSDVYKDLADTIPDDEIDGLYQSLIFPFVWGLLFSPYDYDMQGIEGFDYLGTNYRFPQQTEFLGQKSDLEDIDAAQLANMKVIIDIVEKAATDRYNYLPSLVAVLAKSSVDELLTDELIKERSELFKKLPISYTFELFFYLNEYSEKLVNGSQTYLNSLAVEAVD